jgi:beta-aspartyl-peptidase (threonine type)
MSEQAATWAVVVHGGAKTIKPELRAANRDGCRAAADAGAAVLRYGGNAIAAVEAAVRVLENDPVFNAGYGSVLNADGEVEMDAALMDGARLDLGGVAAVRTIRNPIAAAARLLREQPVLLVAGGAERFAREAGVEMVEPGSMIAPGVAGGDSDRGHDTVGCVALDVDGHVAAANSTGGLSGTRAGRVGDSPLPGCGLYADDHCGAVALSGDGEAIARTMLASRIIRALEEGADAQGAAAAIRAIERVGGEAGAIVLDRSGRIGIAHNSDHFAIGVATSTHPARGVIDRTELRETTDE